MMSTIDQSDFNNTEILDDSAIEKIGQEVNELIELLDDDEDDDDNHSTVRYPGLASNSTKRNHEDQDGILFIIIIKVEFYLIAFIVRII